MLQLFDFATEWCNFGFKGDGETFGCNLEGLTGNFHHNKPTVCKIHTTSQGLNASCTTNWQAGSYFGFCEKMLRLTEVILTIKAEKHTLLLLGKRKANILDVNTLFKTKLFCLSWLKWSHNAFRKKEKYANRWINSHISMQLDVPFAVKAFP